MSVEEKELKYEVNYHYAVSRGFAVNYKTPEFPTEAREVNNAPQKYFRFLENIRPRLDLLESVDAQLCNTIKESYIALAIHVLHMTQALIPLFYASKEERGQGLTPIHDIYFKFSLDTQKLMTLYRNARTIIYDEIKKCAIECEENGADKRCKEYKEHCCFFIKHGRSRYTE